MHHNSLSGNTNTNSSNLLSGKRLLLLLTLGGITLLFTWLILLSAAMNSIMSSTTNNNDASSSSSSSASSSSSSNKNIDASKSIQQSSVARQQNEKNQADLKEEDIFVNEPINVQTIRHLKMRIIQLEHLLIDASAALKQSSKSENNNGDNKNQVIEQSSNVCDQLRHDLIQSLQAEKELQIELSKCKVGKQIGNEGNEDHVGQNGRENNNNHNDNEKQQPNFDQLLKEQREIERKYDAEVEKKNHFGNQKKSNNNNNVANEVVEKDNSQHENNKNQQQQEQYPAEHSGGRIVKGPGSDPSVDEYGTIPILILSYNRPKLLKKLLARIQELLLNTNKKHGIDRLPPFRVFVSQDFDGSFPDVTAEIQEAQTRTRKDLGIVFMMHNRDDSGATPQEESNGWKSYYAISKHYAWAISQTLGMNQYYRRVIILEEDLELAFDFFEYMVGMSSLFDKDPTLYCVSGFNDNGKAALVEDSSAVYRSDFFPGLGWMISRELWADELRAKWPRGFWDDWMRQPLQRRGRACLRPEISRSKPICEDGEGASQGQFCSEHLKQIVLNDPLRSRLVHWNNFNLDTLLPRIYDSNLQNEVHRAKTVYNVQSIFGNTKGGSLDSSEVKMTYGSNDEFVVLAHALNLMDDFKDGVPRTAYQGIVTIKWREQQQQKNNFGYQQQQQQQQERRNNNRVEDSAVMFSNKANEEDVTRIRKVHLVSEHLLYENSQKS